MAQITFFFEWNDGGRKVPIWYTNHIFQSRLMVEGNKPTGWTLSAITNHWTGRRGCYIGNIWHHTIRFKRSWCRARYLCAMVESLQAASSRRRLGCSPRNTTPLRWFQSSQQQRSKKVVATWSSTARRQGQRDPSPLEHDSRSRPQRESQRWYDLHIPPLPCLVELATHILRSRFPLEVVSTLNSVLHR